MRGSLLLLLLLLLRELDLISSTELCPPLSWAGPLVQGRQQACAYIPPPPSPTVPACGDDATIAKIVSTGMACSAGFNPVSIPLPDCNSPYIRGLLGACHPGTRHCTSGQTSRPIPTVCTAYVRTWRVL